jgi:hypothetical protein
MDDTIDSDLAQFPLAENVTPGIFEIPALALKLPKWYDDVARFRKYEFY